MKTALKCVGCFCGLISFVFGISMWNSKYVYNDCKSRWRTTPTENKTFLTSPSWKVLICGRTLYLSPSKKGPYFVSDPTNAIMIIQGTLYQRLFRFLVWYRWHFGLLQIKCALKWFTPMLAINIRSQVNEPPVCAKNI